MVKREGTTSARAEGRNNRSQNDGTFEAQNGGASTILFSGTWEQVGNAIQLTVDHSGGRELPYDTDQPLSASISDDGKSIKIGAAVFKRK